MCQTWVSRVPPEEAGYKSNVQWNRGENALPQPQSLDVLKFLYVQESSVAQNGQPIGMQNALLKSFLQVRTADDEQHSAYTPEDPFQALASLLFL